MYTISEFSEPRNLHHSPLAIQLEDVARVDTPIIDRYLLRAGQTKQITVFLRQRIFSAS